MLTKEPRSPTITFPFFFFFRNCTKESNEVLYLSKIIMSNLTGGQEDYCKCMLANQDLLLRTAKSFLTASSFTYETKLTF